MATDIGASLPKPTKAQLAWQDFEVGALYHFDLTTFREDGADHSRGEPPLDMSLFNPTKLDTDQWLAAAQAMGAKYALFTATHETGFLHWQSDLYPYGLKQSKWRDGKGDIVGDFVESCRKCGIKPGLFIGLRFNTYWDAYQYQVQDGDEAEQAAYIRMCEQMTEELCSRYGELAKIWIEGGALSPEDGGPDILPIVEKHRPNTVFYHSKERADHRWVGNERGVAGYPCWATTRTKGGRLAHQSDDYRKLLPHGDPDGPFWSPAMCDVPIRDHSWFWHPNEDHKVYALDALVDMYYKSVGRNAVLTVGATPDRDGLIPDADMRRCEEFGNEIRRRLSDPIAGTSGEGNVLELTLPRPSRIDHVILMEDIADGERVRGYRVEGLVGRKWQRLCDGTSIGHKHIQQVGPVEVAKIRFTCTESVAIPKIRNMAVYDAR